MSGIGERRLFAYMIWKRVDRLISLLVDECGCPDAVMPKGYGFMEIACAACEEKGMKCMPEVCWKMVFTLCSDKKLEDSISMDRCIDENLLDILMGNGVKKCRKS